MNRPIHRRSFLTVFVTAASAWPLAAGAQQQKHIGVLMLGAASEASGQASLATFIQGMRKLGWIDGQNLRTEVRWSAADVKLMEAYATDLVGLFRPDILLAAGSANLIALQRATNTIPIVFTNVTDPVAQGFVPTLTHPGGNITGFAYAGFPIAGKWADLLKQMVPEIRRVALVFNPESSPQSKLYLSALEAAAPSLGMEVMTALVHSTAEIEATMTRLSREPNIGLIFPTDSFTASRAKLIVEAAARYRLPAIYSQPTYITEGGLMYYFSDGSGHARQVPYYIDRILKGTKPGDLPVQLPTKFKFVVNRKTATALGIEVPLGLLLAADEVIE